MDEKKNQTQIKKKGYLRTRGKTKTKTKMYINTILSQVINEMKTKGYFCISKEPEILNLIPCCFSFFLVAVTFYLNY